MSRLTLSRELSNDSLSDDKVLQYPWPRFTPKRSFKSRISSADFWDVLPSCQGMLAEWLNGQFTKEANHSNVPLETIYKLWKLFINHIQKDSFYYEISQRAGSKIEPWKQKVQQMLWVFGSFAWGGSWGSNPILFTTDIRYATISCTVDLEVNLPGKKLVIK